MGFIDNVLDFFRSVWEWVKRIWTRILNFFKNIVAWFKDPNRLQRLKQNKKVIATSIKERLDNGEYGVVNCLFNTATGEIEGEAEGIESEQVDEETQRKFGNNEMIVLK
ncbi:hypothetical protein HBZC1_11260 [Helicobacter bizzozeronii CIII-1]|uniref:Uncharacterized protein n=1 Tax=Helicobacter bizzozeronii (strain CIII-1) TaxID=1002804 RepID=F8KTF8_HELBC|nr:hypothetical protein [Helicobacter bizzozeronii]CCB80112.1 hypothetical protein HBZC1_11260 [Helicobacter bizzozeronii CIII-1]